MADYNIEELSDLVKADIISESQGVDEVPVVSSLVGINSLPALRGNDVVQAPLELLSQPAVDAANAAKAATSNAVTATNNAVTATTNANTATKKVNDAILDLNNEKKIIADVATAEQTRVSNENARKTSESARVAAESARVTAENKRVTVENNRVAAESSRVTAESKRVTAETSRSTSEETRKTNELARQSNEDTRQTNESARQQVKADMVALNEEIRTHQPRINTSYNWEVWDAVNKKYVDTGVTGQGKTPIIREGVWWIWDDAKDDYVSTGWSVNTDYQLTKEAVDGVLGGSPTIYIEEWKHTHTPYKKGLEVKFNQEFYIALKDTELPPIDLVILEDGVIAKIDEYTYATQGSYDAIGNKEDWKKIPYNQLRLVSREGTLNENPVDVCNLSGDEVYQFEPNLEIDLLKGTIKGKKVDLTLPKKNVTDALGDEYVNLKSQVTNHTQQIDSLEDNALVSTYTLEQSSNPSFEVSSKNAAKLYVANMGGYLFYNGNADGKVYAAKLNHTNWDKFADGTPVTAEIEAATETMVHVPECHFKASGKTMKFGGIIPIEGGKTFGSPHWVGAYQGYIADGALHSRPNVAPSHSKTMEVFWNYAQSLHANKQYGLAGYQFHQLINALFQSYYGNLDSQDVIGSGFQTSSWEMARDVPMGKLKNLGDGSGKVLYNDATLGDQYPVKLFGFENLWGKLWEFRPNIRFEMRDNVRYAIVYDGNRVSNTATGREFVSALQSLEGSYVKSMKLGEWWDMLPETIGGSSVTYYCDGTWSNPTGKLLYVGGYGLAGQMCGLSYMSLYYDFSHLSASIGARLTYWGEPTIIGGSELVSMINSTNS